MECFIICGWRNKAGFWTIDFGSVWQNRNLFMFEYFSNNSKAAVPCPLITSKSLEGWMKVAPFSIDIRSALVFLSFKVGRQTFGKNIMGLRGTVPKFKYLNYTCG